MTTKFDIRQSISHDTLDQIATTTGKEVDDLLRSVNQELTAPLRLKPSSPADLIVHIENIVLTNPETSVRRTIPPINSLLPSFSSGTVTFPASSGGNATPSVGSTIVITISSGNFLKVGINLDSAGNIVLAAGTQGASEAAATMPATIASTFQIGYVVLQNVAGTIQNIASTAIVQFTGGGGGGDVTQTGTQTLTNKTFVIDGASKDVFQSATGTARQILMDASTATNSTATTIKAIQTANRTLTMPDATDTFAVLGTNQTFTAVETFNQGATTVNNPSINLTISGSGTSLWHPVLTIDTGKTYTVSAGAFLTSTHTTINGTLTISGTVIIL